MSRVGDIVGMAAGISAIAVFITFTAYSAHLEPEFSLFSRYLSDLGVGEGGRWFNTGIMLACLLGLVFVVFALRPSLSPSISRELGVAFAGIMCAFGVLAGIYTEEDLEAHTIASMGVFISMVVALGFVTYSLRIDDPLGRDVTRFSEFLLAGGIVLLILGNNPVGETVTVMMMIVWMTVLVHARWRRVLESGPRAETEAGPAELE